MNLIKKGTTDVTRYVKLVDSAAGTPETGYTITSLDLQYTRNRTAPAAKVDATALAATDSAHGDNQAIQVDATSSPGLYRVDWPDAAFATGADKVILCVSGTGLDPCFEEIQLVDFDPSDAVRLGLTALPNAAADGAGGLPISDAGGLDLDAQVGTKINSILDDTGTAGVVVNTFTTAGKAEVESEVSDGLIAKGLDHLVFASVTGADVADNSIIAQLVSKSATADWDSYTNTTDSLEANRDNIGTAGAGLTAADDAVVTLIGVAGAGLTEAGGDGDHLTAINLPNQTMDITGNITGNLSGSVGSVTGNVTGSVGSLAAQAQTDVRTATGLASANLDTQLAAIAADLPARITKNVALSAFPFFMVLTSDHITGATGKTVTATRSLDGAAFAACANSVTEIANGWYKIDLATTDLNANTVALKFTATDCDARMITIVTQPT